MTSMLPPLSCLLVALLVTPGCTAPASDPASGQDAGSAMVPDAAADSATEPIDAMPIDDAAIADAATVVDAGDLEIDAAEIDAAVIGDCPPDTLCLNVNLASPSVPDGRLGIVWMPLELYVDEHPPQVAYDAVFGASSESIQIPLASIASPEPYQIRCVRTCEACPCLGAPPKTAIAAVVVVVDQDGDGTIDSPAETTYLTNSERYGVGYLFVGYGATAYIPAPSPWDEFYIDGIQAGIKPYVALPPPPGSSWNDLGIPAPGQAFDLHVCAPGSNACDEMPHPDID